MDNSVSLFREAENELIWNMVFLPKYTEATLPSCEASSPLAYNSNKKQHN